MDIVKQDCDVLIVGSGLSGLKAALTASIQPLKIMLVDFYKGPSGSSFSNLNEKLGVQLLKTDEEKEHFVKKAVEVAHPGKIDERLVRIMAEESEKRFLELKEVGAVFKSKNGSFCKYPGCFDPESNTAVIIKNLKELYQNLYRLVKDRIEIKSGWMLIKLLKDPITPRICGAVFVNRRFSELMFVRARSVVMAAGGCTGLFWWNITPEKPSFAMGILKDAGAKLCNENFVQFIWVEKKSKNFFSFEHLRSIKIITERKEIKIPKDLLSLLKERLTHCPIGYELEDFRIDKFLLNRLTNEGVKVKLQDKIFTIVPSAQAQNGGAFVDERAMTSVNGLFACGECASGMHGANRIGGAMVLATQVFGHRAGKYACLWAKDSDFLSDKLFTQLINDFKIERSNLLIRKGSDKEVFNGLKFKLPKALLMDGEKVLNELLEELNAQKIISGNIVLKLKLDTIETMLLKRKEYLRRKGGSGCLF